MLSRRRFSACLLVPADDMTTRKGRPSDLDHPAWISVRVGEMARDEPASSAWVGRAGSLASLGGMDRALIQGDKGCLSVRSQTCIAFILFCASMEVSTSSIVPKL